MDEKFIIGLDEAGRGPLAGPVVAGCAMLPPDFPLELLNDSKKLSEKKRKAAYEVIREKACWGIGEVDHKKIDEINILQASLLAMKKAYEEMVKKIPDWCRENKFDVPDVKSVQAIADGTFCPDIESPVRAEVKADGKFPCVMAASILAKVYRDDLMIEMDKLYPEYNYKKHKGYPTPEHKKICREIGPSPIQRCSFKV